MAALGVSPSHLRGADGWRGDLKPCLLLLVCCFFTQNMIIKCMNVEVILTLLLWEKLPLLLVEKSP